MLRRVGCLLSIAALSAVAITNPAAARRQPSGGQPQPSGSARVTGRVVAADTGTPVRLAQVGLSGLPDSHRQATPNHPYVYFSRQVLTDVNGRFDLATLPAGLYYLTVNPVSGFVRPPRATEATLAAGRTLDVTVRLERSGAIEGRIQDENGDGMFAAEVHAVRRVTFGSHTTLAASGVSATTNDLGEFRLFNLPPGEYYVLATYGRPPGYGPAPRSGYANTYYPGSPALRGARTVIVRAGRDSDRVNFTLARCQLAQLSITPVSSRGVPLGRDTSMSLTRRDDVYLPSSTRQRTHREDGAFRFDGIQPGDYYLLVMPGERMKEGAYVNVSIGEADVSLRVRTNTGVKVSGRVVVDGRAAGPGSAHVTSYPPPGMLGPRSPLVPLASQQENGRFELASAWGPRVLSAGVAGGALLSIRRRGEELAGKTLVLTGTERFDDVVVELTTKVARVGVNVTSASEGGEPEPVMLILFSEDPKRWHHGFIQSASTIATPVSATPGILRPARTSLTGMPPGRYLVAAIPDVGISHPVDAALFEKLRPLAAPVTLVAGETARVTLPVAKAR